MCDLWHVDLNIFDDFQFPFFSDKWWIGIWAYFFVNDKIISSNFLSILKIIFFLGFLTSQRYIIHFFR
jgi:hypothetical protein